MSSILKSNPDIAVTLPLSVIKPIHPFPARMAPSIAFDELPTSLKPLRVLDPMVGSGTTAVVARAKGHHAIGFDSDPLAVMLSSAWCSDGSPSNSEGLAADILAEAKVRAKLLAVGERYPAGASDTTREFVTYWFDGRSRLQLRALADAIGAVSNRRDLAVLWCGFSRLIIAKSRGASLAMDLSHSRPHKVFEKAPIAPFDEFLSAVKRVAHNKPFKAHSSLPKPQIKRHDARTLPLDDSSIDFVITSPPYLNAIDYIRCSKFSLVWMGHQITELQQLRSTNIGSERSDGLGSSESEFDELVGAIGAGELSPRRRGVLRRYVSDLSMVLSEISRVLVPRGKAVFVVGDCTIDGIFIRNSEVIRLLGKDRGLKLSKTVRRDLLPSRRYLPPPQREGNKQLAERMRHEVIMHFEATK